MTDHPITPPLKLVQQWASESYGSSFDIATRAAQWGADQELEACCGLLVQQGFDLVDYLHAARRPKPPSLKEQALETLKYPKDLWSENEVDTIRRALESIND